MFHSDMVKVVVCNDSLNDMFCVIWIVVCMVM